MFFKLLKTQKKKYENRLNNPLFFSQRCKFCAVEHSCRERLWKICNCKGSIGLSHRYCLVQWQSHKYNNKDICDICGTSYIIPDE